MPTRPKPWVQERIKHVPLMVLVAASERPMDMTFAPRVLQRAAISTATPTAIVAPMGTATPTVPQMDTKAYA